MITYFFANSCTFFFSKKASEINWTKIAHHNLFQGKLAGSRDWLLRLCIKKSLMFPWQSKCRSNYRLWTQKRNRIVTNDGVRNLPPPLKPSTKVTTFYIKAFQHYPFLMLFSFHLTLSYTLLCRCNHIFFHCLGILLNYISEEKDHVLFFYYSTFFIISTSLELYW